MTQLTPDALMEIGACSREEPHPKMCIRDSDEYVQASLGDFLNLQNGLFIVNVSNTSNTELTLGAPEHITVSPIQFSGRTLHIPVLYTFGTIDFYMERVSIKE